MVRETVGAGVQEEHAVLEVPLEFLNGVEEEVPELKLVPQLRSVDFLLRQTVHVAEVTTLL